MESPQPLEFSQDPDPCDADGCKEDAAEACVNCRCQKHCVELCGPDCPNPRF